MAQVRSAESQAAYLRQPGEDIFRLDIDYELTGFKNPGPAFKKKLELCILNRIF